MDTSRLGRKRIVPFIVLPSVIRYTKYHFMVLLTKILVVVVIVAT